jgi:hypothetical protein
MNMRGLILFAAAGVLAAATLGACYTDGDVGYTTPRATVYASSGPDLVTVSPGVQVVADYDEPVFYTDGFYWRFYNGGWYRSNDYASGWYFAPAPPIVIARIDRPYAYVHYRPRGYVARSSVRYRRPEPIVVRDHRTVQPQPAVRSTTVVRDHRTVQPQPSTTVVRDHRTAPVAAPPPRAPAPTPVVRDHRSSKETRDHREH